MLDNQDRESFDESIIDLYLRGLITIEYDENLEARINLTRRGKRLAEILKETFRD